MHSVAETKSSSSCSQFRLATGIRYRYRQVANHAGIIATSLTIQLGGWSWRVSQNTGSTRQDHADAGYPGELR